MAWLQEEVEVPGRANLLLTAEPDPAAAEARLRSVWTPADAELEFRDLDDGRREARSRRVFFDEPVLDAMREVDDGAFQGIFTYFVNELRGRATSWCCRRTRSWKTYIFVSGGSRPGRSGGGR